MTVPVYQVQIIAFDRPSWVDDLKSALSSELMALGIHRSVECEVGADPLSSKPGVVIFFGSRSAASDPSTALAIDRALLDLRVIVPVVDDLAEYREQTPPALHAINGWEWQGVDAPQRLARLVLEELGIEERQRSVFVSHKREDGMLAAEQMYEFLSKHAFDPFIDRFEIRPGVDVQATIADALEARAFLLVLETPLAHTSDWVFDEVDYALSHTMGIHIVSWPNNPREVPDSGRLPRQRLSPADLESVRSYDTLSEEALDYTLAEIEAAHALALVRRRRSLIRSVEDSADARGLRCTPLPGWRLLVRADGRLDVVGVTSRLPEVSDLRGLDEARVQLGVGDAGGVLVHAARRLLDDRRGLLTWAAGDRPLTLVPENAVGGYW